MQEKQSQRGKHKLPGIPPQMGRENWAMKLLHLPVSSPGRPRRLESSRVPGKDPVTNSGFIEGKKALVSSSLGEGGFASAPRQQKNVSDKLGSYGESYGN